MTAEKRISRRGLLKKGSVAAAAVALAPHSASAQAQPVSPERQREGGPSVVTNRTFRAWISRGTGRGRTTLQEVTLRPISGRQVVVRTEATNLCYSNVRAVLGIQARRRRGRGDGVGARRAGRRTPMNDMARHPGARRRRRRRGRGTRGPPRAGRRSRLRVGHAAVRRLLSLPARPRRHVSVPGRHGADDLVADRGHCATARPSTRTRTSAGWPS